MSNNEEKILIAQLIENVVLKKQTVAQAIELFPNDRNDIDIKCAFDALIYYDADEDIRKKDAIYAQVQDDYLIDIASFLKENKKLPKNIIENYLKYNKDNLIGDWDNSLKGIMNKIKRMINF